jgi:uncharacterized membrane protein YeaQ/YmgE (transglycosylase-associated protein family)
MVGTIIGLVVIGLVSGYVARAIIPGRQEMTIVQTLLLGVVGSFLGGALGWLLFDTGGGLVQTASWIGSIIGAAIVLGARTMLDDRRRRAITR